MSYEKTMKGVERLVRQELDMASKDNGDRFNSPHEAYAVILEELEELTDELATIDFHLAHMWIDVKNDDEFGDCLTEIERHARRAACEAIQVAAMARKAMS